MASDVQIYCSRKTTTVADWSPPMVAVRRQDKPRNAWLSNVTLGNPVLLVDADRVVWLFYTATTVGHGWSAAHVEYRTSGDFGTRWSQARRLTDGFGNLTRIKPLLGSGGKILLPLYHEFIGRQSFICEIHTSDRKVVRRKAFPIPGQGIQPTMVELNGAQVIYMRVTAGERVLRSVRTRTGDWARPEPTNVLNPDSSVDAIDAAGGVLLVCNPSPDRRRPLSLLFSTDGLRFSAVADIESASVQADYPALIRDTSGVYHVVYTYGRREAIKHVSFTEDWLMRRLPGRVDGR